jgi:ubiquinone/menaquinone biosynthesis C-methylase UbiE
MPRADNAVEMLDRPAALADLRESLSDVSRLNALFGGRRVTLIHVERLLSGLPAGRPLTVLDVGTGGADIPRALVRWARRAGRRLRVFALDRDLPTLRVARGLGAGYPEIVLVQGDALALPVRLASVDVVISALTLHHLEPEAAARALAEMDAAARRGLVVNDLVRSRTAYRVVWLATRLLARNRMSRHDGPLSVRRAYAAGELRALCEKAGLFDARIFRYPLLFRHCVVRAKP